MAVIETWFEQDLQKAVQVRHINGSLFSNNANGNRIGVSVFNNGEPVTLTGTVSGYAILSDGTTVPCTGQRSGNKASVLVPPAAYLPGAIFFSVFLTDGNTVTTLAAVSSTVQRTRTDNQVSPGSVVTDWTQTINAAMQSVESAAENLGGIIATPYASLTYPVPLGKYTYYNDNLYRCISPISASESFTAAHWIQVKLGDDVSELKSALMPAYELTSDDIVNGYVHKDGFVSDNSSFRRTVPIYFDNNTFLNIKLFCNSANVATVVRTDENLSFFENITVGVNDYQWLGVMITKAGYYIISWTYHYQRPLELCNKKINEYNVADEIIDSKLLKLDIATNDIITGYIHVNGTVSTNASYRRTNPIYFEKGTTLYVKALGTATVSIISATDSTGSYYLNVINGDNTNRWYIFHVTVSGYYIISYEYATGLKAYYMQETEYDIYDDIIHECMKKYIIQSALITGYININGTVSTNQYFRRTDPLYFEKGTILYIKAKGETNTVSVVAETDAEQSYYKSILSGVIAYQWNIVRINQSGYYILSTKYDSPILLYYSHETEDDSLVATSSATVALFQNWAVIGDSWSAGAIHTTEDSADDADTVHENIDLSWERILARKTGTAVSCYAAGGLSTRTWLTSSNGLPAMQNDTAKELYFIMLGINDVNRFGIDYLGTSADINLSDYTQNADSFYGNMGKIIALIKLKSPLAKIVIIDMAIADTDNKVAYNNAMKNIAGIYGIAYLHQLDDPFYQTRYFQSGMMGYHPTAVVLSGMASAIDRQFSRCVVNQYSYFKGFYWDA